MESCKTRKNKTFPFSQRHFFNVEFFGWLFLFCLMDALGRDDDSLKVVLERCVAAGGGVGAGYSALMERRAEGAAGLAQGGCTFSRLFKERHYQRPFSQFYEIPNDRHWNGPAFILKGNGRCKEDLLIWQRDLFVLAGRGRLACLLQKRCSLLAADRGVPTTVHGAEMGPAAC